ncbi:J domain-containing protein [Modicisalibacter tunisiensis]|uniref:J domain-containing protein n=1 Tax=Modicisalibacter tunisiensis TaxID=390637 RepID=A0ABS7WUA2_9GAMM|nr:J domain-containing protein [Modicisalibacter tunisiensis]MBZ9566192.1 J domain-containing protein [Modicisalibacter tunisiensis]
MPPSSFTPFELLLLKSRNQTDTAALLMLAWILANKARALPEDRDYLDTLAGDFHHGHALAPLIETAATQDMAAIQLAAEVLQKDWQGEPAHPFLRQAIALATSGGPPSHRNHHVLRFLADLLGVAPGALSALFKSVTGQPLPRPEDPSRAGYWAEREHRHQRRAHADDTAQARAEEDARHRRASETRRREEAEARARRQAEEEARRRDEQTRRHRERERADRARRQRERAQQRRHEEEAARRRREQERERQRGQEHDGTRPPPSFDTAHALRVLGLDDRASRGEIKRAYRRLAQLHHPDRFHAQGESRMALASRQFQRIQKAYEHLMQDARFV